jgi:hypothetical protein
MDFRIRTNKIYTKLRNLPETIGKEINAYKIEAKERKIAKNFKIHDYTTEGNVADDLYNMRVPIANFAKKNNLRLDVYDSRTAVNVGGFNISHSEKDAKYNLNVVVTDLKNKKNFSMIIPCKKDATYPKILKKKVILPINGEQDLSIVRDVISTRDDNYLRNFYFQLEKAAEKVNQERKKF